jgi:galactosylceramide sulfotransferase
MPAQNVFYLKIHKCSSSTMQAIFARYAVWNKLTTVIFEPNHSFPHPALHPFIDATFKGVEKYNMLTSHIVFSENQIRQLLPKDAKFLTIVREPFSLLQSAFNFFMLCKGFKMPVCSLPEFLSDPEKYDARATVAYVKDYKASPTKNFMAQHLGYYNFSPLTFNISDWIEYIDERFHFIGLTEHMLESLVYIRRLLNWTTKDVLSLHLRDTSNQNHQYKLQPLNETEIPELRKKYRAFSPVDHLLYEHFAERFREKTNALGEDFRREVESFTSVQRTVSDFCSKACPDLQRVMRQKMTPNTMANLRRRGVRINGTAWHGEFSVSLEDCLLMMADPDSIRRINLRRKQQYCSGAECEWYLGRSLPTKSLHFLNCIL